MRKFFVEGPGQRVNLFVVSERESLEIQVLRFLKGIGQHNSLKKVVAKLVFGPQHNNSKGEKRFSYAIF